MERLYHVLETGGYDLVVLDTPPSRSALEIVDAPGRLARFLDEGVVSWFVRSSPEPSDGRIAQRTGALALRLLSLLASRKLVRELSAFFGLFYSQRAGFSRRAEAIGGRLTDPTTAFLLVLALSPTSIDEARFLADSLSARGVSLRGSVFNRAYTPDPDAVEVALGEDHARAPVEVDRALLGASVDEQERVTLERELRGAVEQAVNENRRARGAMEAFLESLGDAPVSCVLPDLDGSVHDLQGLDRLASILRAR
jgi:anion-transporting  ArsA/GET3 family ATPase